MYGFIIVLIFIFVGFALISVEFDQDQTPYTDQLYNTFKILFANYDYSSFSSSQKFFTALIVFLLNVVLLNMLISIMGETYDRVQESRVVNDSSTRLDMALEALVFMRSLRSRKVKEERKGYLVYCEPDVEVNDASKDNEWEGQINMIKEVLRENEVKV